MQSKDESAIQVTSIYIKDHQPRRAVDGHKGTFGTLSVRVGSFGMGGASVLCGKAGLRSGVGKVCFVSDKDMILPLMTLCPEATSEVFPKEGAQRIRFWRAQLKNTSAVVIGPGLHPDEKNALHEILFLVEHAPRLLIDAGAITVVALYQELFDSALKKRKDNLLAPVVMTPHPGECARLIPSWNKSDRTQMPAQYAKDKGVVLVLKGQNTVVFTPDMRSFINTTGNNGLAKAGSGDVLSGIIGGFLAQKIDETTAAVAGVYFHGLSGDIISESIGARAMQPTDVMDALPEAYATCGWN